MIFLGQKETQKPQPLHFSASITVKAVLEDSDTVNFSAPLPTDSRPEKGDQTTKRQPFSQKWTQRGSLLGENNYVKNR
jgi:hypothetical protein